MSNGEDLLRDAIMQMRNGDIKAFIVTRNLMDDIDFIALASQVDEKDLGAYFLGRCFLEQVISNLAADSMFEFPPSGAPLNKVFSELAANTGNFLYELVLNEKTDHVKGASYLNHAIRTYFDYLGTLHEVGQVSDLGNSESIWQVIEVTKQGGEES